MSNEGVWIKVRVPAGVHGALRVKAFGVGKKLGDYVVELLSGSGLRAVGTGGDAQRGGSIPRSKTVKATLDVVSESKNPAPRPQPSTPPVSGFSCKVCGKPTDGAYVCKGCVDKQKDA